jgi:PPOX class probable F420-dependent enzyme
MRLSDEARAFLDAHMVGHLATADPSSVPHVIPLCYARIDDRLYFVADDKPKRLGPRRLKRLGNIAANPRVALVVDDYHDDWSRLAYLLLHLDAVLVEDEAEYAAALTALRHRYPQYQGMQLNRNTHPMVRMTPRRWHLWRSR